MHYNAIIIFFTGISLFCTSHLYAQKKHASPPNIIYIMADQLRHDALGYAGNKQAQTPHIDRLAAGSMNFTNCVSATPVCAPYRASLFTGKYSSSTGLVTNETRLHPNQISLANVLNGGGYQTGYIGKWHLYSNVPGAHDDPSNAHIPPGKYRLGFDGEWMAYNFHHTNFNSVYYRDSPQPLKYQKAYEPEAQFDMAIDYVKRHKGEQQPFALFLSVGIPHDPWVKGNVPEKYYNRFKDVTFKLPDNWSDMPDPRMDRNTDQSKWLKEWKAKLPEMMRVYAAMVASLDDNMGRLMQYLESQGLMENTIIVFTTDHGEMFGENGRVFKLTFYESAARVPFLISWKGQIPAGHRTDALLNTPDIMPTLLGLTRLPVPATVEGMDLSLICKGQRGPEPSVAFLQGMGHTFQWIDGFEWRAVRDKRYTYARYLKDGKELLFDNQTDPLQLHNLAGNPAHQVIYEDLKAKMARKMKELNDEFKPLTWYRDHWTDGKRNITASAKGRF